jgi:hypothetical protein
MVSRRHPNLSDQELQQAAPHRIKTEDALLCSGLLLAPIAWAVHFALSYGLVYPAARWQSKASLHLVALAAGLFALASIALGWRGLRNSRRGSAVDEAQRDRTRFLASCACLAGAFFLIAILAQTVPVAMLSLGGRP